MDVSIDIETLDTGPRAVVLAIGACLFDRNRFEEQIEMTLDVQPQLDAGRTVSMSTLHWWRAQPEDVWDRATLGTQFSLTTAMAALSSFLEPHDIERVWAKDPHFDMVILRDLFHAHAFEKLGSFSNYRNWRSVRTQLGAATSVSGQLPPKATRRLAHCAVADARYQAEQLQWSWEVLS